MSRAFGGKISIAKVTKQRELEFGAEFSFELLKVQLGTDRRGKPVTSCVVRTVDLLTPETEEEARDTREGKLQSDERAVLQAVGDELASGQGGVTYAMHPRQDRFQ